MKRLSFVFAMILTVLPFVGACNSCHSSKTETPKVDPVVEVPDIRMVFLSDVRGAIEPCGCVKDQPGGIDRLGALLSEKRKTAKEFVLLGAGSSFFSDVAASPEKKSQELMKAETLGRSLAGLGLVAIAPGENDFAFKSQFRQITEQNKVSSLACNLESETKSVVLERGGLKIGIVGATSAGGGSGAAQSVRKEVDALKAKGAQLFVVLASTGRGEAKRIADTVPEALAVLVGASGLRADGTPEGSPIEKVGNVLIFEAAHELSSVVTLDLVTKGSKGTTFVDATGEERAQSMFRLNQEIAELRGKIADLEKIHSDKEAEAKKKELGAKESSLRDVLRSQVTAQAPYLRYSMEQVRESSGKDEVITKELLAYYKKVNDANREQFASRVPLKVGKGEPEYAGVEACSTCHAAARKVWEGTAHAHAYATLSSQYKEFNLDCVNCHVTGYGEPGGSTVTHVERLQNVQCETCHGPGSLHVANPMTAIPVPRPQSSKCVTCHHPPHVHSFDADEKMKLILGPGHGNR